MLKAVVYPNNSQPIFTVVCLVTIQQKSAEQTKINYGFPFLCIFSVSIVFSCNQILFR